MSGSSTLRICLAAMAPALTEVTARFKLQDTSSANKEPRSNRLENNTNRLPALQKSIQAIVGDFRTPGGPDTSKAAPPPQANLSHTVKFNGTRLDPHRSGSSSGPGQNSVASHLSSVVVGSATCLRKVAALNTIDSPVSGGVVEAGESCRLQTQSSQLIDGLRIMNQHTPVAEKPADLTRKDAFPSGSGSQGGDRLVKVTIKLPVVINGGNELKRLSCSEVGSIVTEKGDGFGQFETKSNSLEEKCPQFALPSSQTVNSDKKKMGVKIEKGHVFPVSAVEEATKSEAVMDDKAKEEMRKECSKKLVYFERKVSVLLRRLKRIKGKVVDSHTREQLKHFVNFQHRNLQRVAKSIKNEVPSHHELKGHFLTNEEVKNMSTAQLVKLVKTYQPLHQTSFNDSASGRFRPSSSSALSVDPTQREQTLKAAEKLAQRIQLVSAELDSDATASSSGGESGEEDAATSSYHPADLPPLHKRAEWQWAVDRAAVVSRWTWLQAQVSDLEYRIRQQSQIYRQLRNSKGGVVLGEPSTSVELLRRLHGLPSSKQASSTGRDGRAVADGCSSSEPSSLTISTCMSSMDRQSSRLAQCQSPALSAGSSPGSSKLSSPFVNGVTDSPSSTSTSGDASENSSGNPTELRLKEKASDLFDHVSPAMDSTCQSARCRPLRSYRKRRILRTIGLYKTSVKAARLSDIKCRCSSRTNPCPMCGGRYNNTLPVDPDTMPLRERIAILDPSFHPVLSFPHDIKLSIHCEGLLKTGSWQGKALPRSSRVKEFKKPKIIPPAPEVVKKTVADQDNGKNAATTSVINLSTNIKNKYETKTPKRPGPKPATVKPHVEKVKKKAKISKGASKKKVEKEEDQDEDFEEYLQLETTSKDSNLANSISQSSLKDSAKEVQHRKRKTENAFDINNIVIPLSMAASTRVEQPQYKEIVTPKWREVSTLVTSSLSECSIAKRWEKTNGVSVKAESQKHSCPLSEGEEDVSDDKFAARHLLLELEEKKRFRSFVLYPPVRRNRTRSELLASAHGDKQVADCEAANFDDGCFSSRPSTPSINKGFQTNEDSMDSLQQQLSARRRTMSVSRRERSGSVITEDVRGSFIDFGCVEPWPKRTFPLSDEEYRGLVRDLPPTHEPTHRRIPRRLPETSGRVHVGGSADSLDDTGVQSPHPSIETTSSTGDDPNDPEWIVTDVPKRGRVRRFVHDDPNDPEWTGSDIPKRNKNKR